jgi:hypothetical protein
MKCRRAGFGARFQISTATTANVESVAMELITAVTVTPIDCGSNRRTNFKNSH